MALTLAAAALGSALIGGASALYGASQQSKAADQAQQAQAQAAQQQLAAQQQAREQALALNQPFIAGGNAAFQKLLQQYGLAPAATPTTGAAPAPGAVPGQPAAQPAAAPSYSGYLAANPDLAAEAQRVTADGEFPSQQAYLAWHDQHYPQENRPATPDATVPVAAQAGAAPTSAPTPTPVNPYGTAPDLTNAARPAFALPSQPAWGGAGAAPDQASYFKNFEADPSYDFRKSQGIDSANSGFAARGLLKSGAAAKGIVDYSSNLASTEYQNWFTRQNQLYNEATQQYNADRSANYNIFNTERNTANTNAENTYATNNNNFTTDRQYQTNQFNTNTGNLFSLANIGVGATGAATGANTNFANQASNIYGSTADATAAAAQQRAQANAGAVGSIAGSFSNLLTNPAFGTPAAANSNTNTSGTVNLGSLNYKNIFGGGF